MGFLDKLLGRKKDESAEGMQSAPPPASLPADEPHEHSQEEGEQTPGEGEHSHDR
jgi:hypothetical protein